MKILIVTQCFYPDIYAVNDIVRILMERGHSVTVLTGLPDYTTSEIPEEYKHGKNRRQNFYGADVRRVSIIPRKHGPIWRSLNYISFAVTGSVAAKFSDWNDFDIIYVWEVSPVTMAIPAIVLKNRFKKPLFLYCMDIWPECVKAMGFKENTIPYNMIRGISRWVYQRCDHIAVSSEPFFEYLERVDKCDRNRMSYLPQFASSEMLKQNFTKEPDGHIDFLYIGNIGKAQNMPCLIKAIAKLKDRDNVTFHIIGSGSEYENVVNLAADTGADKIIKFYGSKPFNEAMEYYKIADACVLTLDGSNHIGDTLPGKLQTYMAAGKPIIASMNGAGKQVIEEAECGYCCKAGDDKELANLFRAFIAEYPDYSCYGRNAKLYFEKHFTEREHFEALELQLTRLCAKGLIL